jgi:phosphatidylserine/phosphatidylglycerophosphate/cardiolipin synthase-like enzyme
MVQIYSSTIGYCLRVGACPDGKDTKVFSVLSWLANLCSNIPVSHAIDLTLTNTQAQVCFSPGEDCTDAIIGQIGKARTDIFVQAYSFTSVPIAKALVNAHKRGIHVEIILNKSNKSKKYSAGDFTAHMGVVTYIDSQHAIAHDFLKYLILSVPVGFVKT